MPEHRWRRRAPPAAHRLSAETGRRRSHRKMPDRVSGSRQPDVPVPTGQGWWFVRGRLDLSLTLSLIFPWAHGEDRLRVLHAERVLDSLRCLGVARDLLSQLRHRADFCAGTPRNGETIPTGTSVAAARCGTCQVVEMPQTTARKPDMGRMRGGGPALGRGARVVVKGCTTLGFCLKELRLPRDRLPLSIVDDDGFSVP